MNLFLLGALFLCNISITWAQDERFYREIFTKNSIDVVLPETVKVSVSTPEYQWDLDQDGRMEQISAQKRDGVNYFTIKDHHGQILLEKKLHAHGRGAELRKITAKNLSKKTDVYILHFYQGATYGPYVEATQVLYFLTIDDLSLKTLSLFKGPSTFQEKQQSEGVYWNRFYRLIVEDFNLDGVKEISVQYNRIARVYYYKGQGEWF